MTTPAYVQGRHSYGAPEIARFESRQCVVGNFCSIASGTLFMVGGGHQLAWTSTFPFPEFATAFPNPEVLADPAVGGGWHPSRGGVRVGSDVWIGLRTTVMSGVTIGHGAVVGACAVVTRDVPPYAVVVGNPARVVRRRFDAATVDGLLKLAWWNWSDRKITALLALILAPPDVAKLEAASLAYDRAAMAAALPVAPIDGAGDESHGDTDGKEVKRNGSGATDGGEKRTPASASPEPWYVGYGIEWRE
jgi:acetyltransferase-like isoleucine patch superfamily enzyme